MEGGQANGHKPEVLEKIWADWEKFASYAFNKSHATCYSWVAYQTAWLKANYPAEYMAGVLSRNLTNIVKLIAFMDECRAMGIAVKGPDINESVKKFGVTKTGEIRFGLGAIKGVGGGAVSAILTEREAGGPFKDIFDFVERVNLSACNRAAVESLAFSGAFDCFPDIKREMFATPEGHEPGFAETLVRYGQHFQADKHSAQASLFDEFEALETQHPPYPKCEPWAPIKLLDEEKRLVGMYLSAHPLDPFFMDLEYGCNTKCANFKEAEEAGRHVTMGGLVTGLQERFSKKGTPWGILSIEDFSGKAEIRLFGKAYLEYKHFGVTGTSVFIDAEFQTSRFNPEKLDFNIHSISLLSEMQGKTIKGVRLKLVPEDIHKGLLDTLQPFMCADSNRNAGAELFIDIYDAENDRTVTALARRHIKVDRHLTEAFHDNDINFDIICNN